MLHQVVKPPKFEKVSFHNYSHNNVCAFQKFLANADFAPLFQCTDVDEAASMLDAQLNSQHDHFFPLKTVKQHPKFIYKPSEDSLNAIKLKKKLYKKFKQALNKVTDSSCNKCNTCTNCIKAVKAWDIYKTQRNLTNRITKSNKRQNLLNDLKVKSSKNDLRVYGDL